LNGRVVQSLQSPLKGLEYELNACATGLRPWLKPVALRALGKGKKEPSGLPGKIATPKAWIMVSSSVDHRYLHPVSNSLFLSSFATFTNLRAFLAKNRSV
jgi:hypothetical protein